MSSSYSYSCSYRMCIPNSHFQSSSSDSNSNSNSPPSSPPHPSSLSAAGAGYIEHAVTKYDTLAGVAIKYGVEVADIRKMNGLITDHQMFALRCLHIPLPGRHPPSPYLSNGSPRSQSSSDRSPRVTPRKASQAMNSLQIYYGLKGRSQNSIKREIPKMALCKKEGSLHLDRSLSGASPSANLPFSLRRKSRSLVKLDENHELSDYMPGTETREGDSDQSGKRIRRRQKSEADFSRTPEKLLEDNTSSSRFSASAITGKCLALRPKAAANRTADVENTGGLKPIPIGLGDSFLASDGSGVRKSSSTSNLQDHETSCATSIWSTSKWTLKPDLQAFSTAAITKPIFDGLSKPNAGRRNKAALD